METVASLSVSGVQHILSSRLYSRLPNSAELMGSFFRTFSVISVIPSWTKREIITYFYSALPTTNPPQLFLDYSGILTFKSFTLHKVCNKVISSRLQLSHQNLLCGLYSQRGDLNISRLIYVLFIYFVLFLFYFTFYFFYF
jgi:hypothetical protein